MRRAGVLSVVLLLGCVTGCHRKPAALPTIAAPARAGLFRDVAAEAGLRFLHSNGATGKKYFAEITGSGCAFLDYDQDGRPDVLLLDAGHLPGEPGTPHSALFHNLGGGRFAEVTSASGFHPTGYCQGVAVGDYDNDGYPDLYVTGYGGNRLFHNERGTGRFTDVTARAGVGDTEGGPRYALSAAWGDYDGDGKLDLFVCHYARWTPATNRPCYDSRHVLGYCQPVAYAGDTPRLYRNLGNGSFADVTHATGLDKVSGRAMGVAWLDYDGDGHEDLFVTCDMQPNLLLRNTGAGGFREVAERAGVAYGDMGTPLSGMGIAVGDYDNDGREDLHVTNFSNQPNSLYRNEGRQLFENRTAASGLAEASNPFLGWGCEFLDYDRDGWRDLVVANGHFQEEVERTAPGITYRQPKSLYRNTGDGRFQFVTEGLGDLAVPTLGRGLAVGDYDGDGRLDVLVNNMNGPAQLLRNTGGDAGHWVSFQLRGTRCNRDARHARITLRASGRRQFAEARAGSSFCSASDPHVYFGLGPAVKLDEVEIQWSGGPRVRARNLSVDRVWQWTEGDGSPR